MFFFSRKNTENPNIHPIVKQHGGSPDDHTRFTLIKEKFHHSTPEYTKAVSIFLLSIHEKNGTLKSAAACSLRNALKLIAQLHPTTTYEMPDASPKHS